MEGLRRGHTPEWAPLVNGLKALDPRQGYWIRVTEPITALIKGEAAPSPALLPHSSARDHFKVGADRLWMMIRLSSVLTTITESVHLWL